MQAGGSHVVTSPLDGAEGVSDSQSSGAPGETPLLGDQAPQQALVSPLHLL